MHLCHLMVTNVSFTCACVYLLREKCAEVEHCWTFVISFYVSVQLHFRGLVVLFTQLHLLLCISSTCAFPVMPGQNVCCDLLSGEKKHLKSHIAASPHSQVLCTHYKRQPFNWYDYSKRIHCFFRVEKQFWPIFSQTQEKLWEVNTDPLKV